jgi:hypothetical protein
MADSAFTLKPVQASMSNTADHLGLHRLQRPSSPAAYAGVVVGAARPGALQNRIDQAALARSMSGR